MKTTVIFDTETTGLIQPSAQSLKAQPYITEIFCLKIQEDEMDFQVLDEFESLLKPPIPLPAKITEITGLTDSDLEGKPAFIEKYAELAEFFTGVDRMVAHNLPFDRSMLANELMRHDKVLMFPWPREHICTIEKSMHIEQRRMNMQRLHEHFFNKGFPDAHRAKNDVLPLFNIYREMRIKGML